MFKTRSPTAPFLPIALFIFHLLVQSHLKTFVILASTVTCGNKILNLVMCFEGKVFSFVSLSLVLDPFTFQPYNLFGFFCCLCWKFAFKIIFAASLQQILKYFHIGLYFSLILILNSAFPGILSHVTLLLISWSLFPLLFSSFFWSSSKSLGLTVLHIWNSTMPNLYQTP